MLIYAILCVSAVTNVCEARISNCPRLAVGQGTWATSVAPVLIDWRICFILLFYTGRID